MILLLIAHSEATEYVTIDYSQSILKKHYFRISESVSDLLAASMSKVEARNSSTKVHTDFSTSLLPEMTSLGGASILLL
jgi:hypothetical protein